MTSARRLLLAACGIAAIGCGSSGEGGGTLATCATRMVTLTGDLDGQPVDVQINTMSLQFQQISRPYTFDVQYAGGMLHSEWNTIIPDNGPAAPATGMLVMPAGTPHAGEIICIGSGTIRTSDSSTGNNYILTLWTLSSGPSCPGAALTGTISGCVAD